MTENLTPAQAEALDALLVAFEKSGRKWESHAPYVEAADLDRKVSGAALAALVRKGLAKQSGALSRQHGWGAAAYRIAPFGTLAARKARESR